jgi:hypothetical protein
MTSRKPAAPLTGGSVAHGAGTLHKPSGWSTASPAEPVAEVRARRAVGGSAESEVAGRPALTPSCGTRQGILDHQAAGEDLCGFCARSEQLAALEAEALRPVPQVRPELEPVSPAAAAQHAAALVEALDSFEAAHRGVYWRSGTFRRAS